jgi:4-amino-4-deoxy-L-arabinose transferase-like glycosyltransferase
MRKLWTTAGWTLLVLLVLRGLTMPLWPLADPTEARYAELGRQMAITGDWVTPRVWVSGYLLPFLGKPPLHFWAEALSIKCFGANEFAARLPSLLGALIAVLATGMVLTRFYGRRLAGLAMVALASCGMFFVLAGTVGVDMVLASMVALAQFAYFAWLRTENPWHRRGWSLLVFLALALGFLAKGPVAVITFGMPVFLWHCLFGEWQRLRLHLWIPGLLLALAIVVPWFWEAQKTNPDFLRHFFVEENFRRFITHDYYDPYGSGHVVPRGGAIVLMFVAALPWSVLAFWLLKGNGLAATRESNRLWSDRWQAFFFLGFAVNVLFWCAGRQFLITYMLPLLPAFAAWFALRWQERMPGREPWIFRGAAGVAVLASLAYLMVPVLTEDRFVKSMKPVLAKLKEMDRTRPPPAGGFWHLETTKRNPHTLYFYGAQDPDAEKWPIHIDGQPGTVILKKNQQSRLFPYLKRLDAGKDKSALAEPPGVIIARARQQGNAVVLFANSDLRDDHPALTSGSGKKRTLLPIEQRRRLSWDGSADKPSLRPAKPGEVPRLELVFETIQWSAYLPVAVPPPAPNP